jgi:hypothetical protein
MRDERMKDERTGKKKFVLRPSEAAVLRILNYK